MTRPRISFESEWMGWKSVWTAYTGVHFEFLMLGAVKVNCSELLLVGKVTDEGLWDLRLCQSGAPTVKARPLMLTKIRLRAV